MIVIRCPYCLEERHEDELTYGGELEVVRPAIPEIATDNEWTEYLYFRTNPKGLLQEQWCCEAGCKQWFKVARNTVNNDVLEVASYDLELSIGEKI